MFSISSAMTSFRHWVQGTANQPGHGGPEATQRVAALVDKVEDIRDRRGASLLHSEFDDLQTEVLDALKNSTRYAGWDDADVTLAVMLIQIAKATPGLNAAKFASEMIIVVAPPLPRNKLEGKLNAWFGQTDTGADSLNRCNVLDELESLLPRPPCDTDRDTIRQALRSNIDNNPRASHVVRNAGQALLRQLEGPTHADRFEKSA